MVVDLGEEVEGEGVVGEVVMRGWRVRGVAAVGRVAAWAGRRGVWGQRGLTQEHLKVSYEANLSSSISHLNIFVHRPKLPFLYNYYCRLSSSLLTLISKLSPS